MPFTNPRLRAEFDDWPSGRDRVKCRFEVLPRDRYGVRVSRTTTDKSGRWCKPKLTTAGQQAAIVDGADGKTYILVERDGKTYILVERTGGVHVSSHDFMDAPALPGCSGAYAFAGHAPELYKELLALIEQANRPS